MANDDKSRYVYNVKTGVANAATPAILQYMHKKNMRDLRLMPKGWKPGDEINLEQDDSLELSDDAINALAKRLAAKMEGASEEDIRVAIADVTGVMPAPQDDEPTLTDANAIQEIVAEIAQMDPDNPDEYTNAGVPDAKVLSKRLGRNVSASMRDEAYEVFKTQQG